MDDLALLNFRVFILGVNGNSLWRDCQFTGVDSCLVVWYYPDSTCLKWDLSGFSGTWYLCWQKVQPHCFSICSCISKIVPTLLSCPEIWMIRVDDFKALHPWIEVPSQKGICYCTTLKISSNYESDISILKY